MKQKININPMTEDHVSCEVCHRTMLKGEQAEPYLTPSRERRLVCQLCAARAQHEGWIREAAAPEMPARPARQPERRGILRRRRRREGPEPETAPVATPEREPRPTANGDAADSEEAAPLRNLIRRSRPRNPRQVKAVPTNAQLKIGRALELFNTSPHPRTVAGLARTLGEPDTGAATSASSAAEVVLTVAWELSWYQFNVDLSDGRDPVRLRAQGQELSELSPDVQDWNCEMAADGTIRLASSEASSEAASEAAGEAAEAPDSTPDRAGEGEEGPL